MLAKTRGWPGVLPTLSAGGIHRLVGRRAPFGGDLRRGIEQELRASKSVVVLWSPHSVASRWVRARPRWRTATARWRRNHRAVQPPDHLRADPYGRPLALAGRPSRISGGRCSSRMCGGWSRPDGPPMPPPALRPRRPLPPSLWQRRAITGVGQQGREPAFGSRGTAGSDHEAGRPASRAAAASRSGSRAAPTLEEDGTKPNSDATRSTPMARATR